MKSLAILISICALVACRCFAEDIVLVPGPDKRAVGGKWVDFTAANRWAKEYADLLSHAYPSDDEKLRSIWQKKSQYAPIELISGKISQITEYGLIVDMLGSLIFIARAPTASLVDDQWVILAAVPIGPYRYSTVLGATKTIKAYDFGVDK
jgi:hypothetical protein